MKQIIFTTILIFAFCLADFAQESEFAPKIEGDPLDRYGKTDFKTYTARLDNLFISVINNPKSKGLIVLRFNKKDKHSYKISPLKNIDKSVNFLKFDKTKLLIAVFEGDFEETTLWVVPQNTEFPKTESQDYKLIKGDELKQQISKIFPKK